MSDLVERLRWHSEDQATGKLRLTNPDGPEAADEIERLREALRMLIAACDAGRPFERGSGGMTLEAQLARTVINGVRASAVEDARAALGEKHG